jgi:hypothetical protein
MGQVDQTALRFNQAAIIVLLSLAFLFDQVWLVAFVAAVMLVGTLWPKAALFKLTYRYVLRPTGLLRPNMIVDDAAQHLFAQGLGAMVLILAVIAFVLGASVLGWVLAGVVVALAAVNLFLHFCLGCFLYYQLSKRGLRPDLPAWKAS